MTKDELQTSNPVVTNEDGSAQSTIADDTTTSNFKDDVSSKIKTITTDLPNKAKASQESPHAVDNSANDASSKFIVQKLKELYHNNVVDAEKKYHLHFNFCLPTDGPIKANEFDAAPMVLLIGQYSTGKTTFVSHLLGEDFPGMHIGPEPTTDKFMALFHGGDESNDDNTDEKFKNGFPKKARGVQLDDSSSQSIATDDIVAARGKLVKGNTLTVTPRLPFSSLSQFGSAFLNHFVGSSSASPLLKRITFIDTPGKGMCIQLVFVHTFKQLSLFLQVFCLERSRESTVPTTLHKLLSGLQIEVTLFFFCLMLTNLTLGKQCY